MITAYTYDPAFRCGPESVFMATVVTTFYEDFSADYWNDICVLLNEIFWIFSVIYIQVVLPHPHPTQNYFKREETRPVTKS